MNWFPVLQVISMMVFAFCVLLLRRLLGIRSLAGSVWFVCFVLILVALTYASKWVKLIYMGAFAAWMYWVAWQVLEEPSEAGA